MAQVIPSITSLPLDSSAAPSVEDIQERLPSICVDYLSHDWNEEDVWASWRSMTRHKNEIANGLRLENASWRTWQKQRNKLRTISPETLNWLKDSDVTWLYGPLHTASVQPVPPPRVADADARLGMIRADSGGKKPILKHRTLSEMLTIPMPSSPILESSRGMNESDEIEDLDGEMNRPGLMQTKSDTNIFRTNAARKRSPPRQPISGKATPGSPPDIQGSASSGKRHISFNTFVEQCISLDEPLDRIVSDDDSSDDVLEMRSSSSRSSRPSFSRNSSTSSDHFTIAKIAPAMLKTTGGHFPSPSPAMVYAPPPEYVSPQNEMPPGARAFDFPSPHQTTTSRWNGSDDEDEYGSVGFDYFGGPDLVSGTSASPKSPSHVGQSYGRPPVVQQPPVQPKWRQAAQAPPAPSSAPIASPGLKVPTPDSAPLSTSTSSTSSSTSLNNASGVTSPLPSRSILKVRPPSATPPNEPSTSPPSYFHFNPSVATGMGAMRAAPQSGEVGPTGSPIVSPSVSINSGGGAGGAEERGRSTSRDRSAVYDRSTSRGTSVSSTHSISPSTRSPVAPPRVPVQAAPVLGKVQEGVTWTPEGMEVEVDPSSGYVPERSSTPTPHSSPQITFRPLADTSPASLPHVSASSTSTKSPSKSYTSSATRTASSRSIPSLPSPPATTSSTISSSGSNPKTPTGKATTATAQTNAQPTILSNQTSSTEISPKSTLHTLQQPPTPKKDGGSGGEEESTEEEGGDGSSIMGRAANIASTAKDLLGALWYGSEPPTGGRVTSTGLGLGNSPSSGSAAGAPGGGGGGGGGSILGGLVGGPKSARIVSSGSTRDNAGGGGKTGKSKHSRSTSIG